jgi:drug/metabolite transporter (DMT)-like permease
MAILIFPIGLLLGWLIRPPRRAAAATAAVGLGGLIFFVVLGLNSDEGVSPIETALLVLGTPIAAALAYKLSRRRLRGAATQREGCRPGLVSLAPEQERWNVCIGQVWGPAALIATVNSQVQPPVVPAGGAAHASDRDTRTG